mmetsp:Transcript_46740/g.84366  ORF Transcript_46740/g.84366 Transcript_46740/m.84366 type:complete len:467 (-) Transcript_46740:412-1812(-)
MMASANHLLARPQMLASPGGLLRQPSRGVAHSRDCLYQRTARTGGGQRVSRTVALAAPAAAAALFAARRCGAGRAAGGAARRPSRRRVQVLAYRSQGSGPAEVATDTAAASAEELFADELAAADQAARIPGRDVPGNAWELGSRVFRRELGQLLLAMRKSGWTDSSEQLRSAFGLPEPRAPRSPPPFLQHLKLDVAKVCQREAERGAPESFPVVKAIFFSLCWSLDRIYEGRPIAKFWVLETIARLPYFSYITALHLYESLGWWRTPQIRHVHSAEEDNELHHLMIMEALGGDCEWFDRFAAQHAAILYYWLVVGLFMASPESAYNFSHLVEEHAYVTYAEFVDANADVLRQVPPPPVAVEYYVSGDLYYFDKFQISEKSEDDGGSSQGVGGRRRPPCDNLLDVFTNIRDDEFEHVRTMTACQEWWGGRGPTPLPKEVKKQLGHRKAWKEWSASVNALKLDVDDKV